MIKISINNLKKGWSVNSIDFINKLIKRKPEERLGKNGIDEIKINAYNEETVSQLNQLIPERHKTTGNFMKIYNYQSKEAYEKSKQKEAKTYVGLPELIYLKDYYDF